MLQIIMVVSGYCGSKRLFWEDLEELEKQKAEYAEKIKNKIAQLHKVAEEKKAMVEVRRGEEILIAAKHGSTGFVPKKAICCFGPQNPTLQLLCAAYLLGP